MSVGGSKPHRPRAHAREPVKKSKGKGLDTAPRFCGLEIGLQRGIPKGGRTPRHTPRRPRLSASRADWRSSSRCKRSRTAFASQSRCWEYWSVYELTHRAPGSRRAAGSRKHSSGIPQICWRTIFICGKPQRYDKPLKQLGLLSRQADIRRVTGASSVNLRQAVELASGESECGLHTAQFWTPDNPSRREGRKVRTTLLGGSDGGSRPSRDIRTAPADGRTGQKAVVRARPPAMLTTGSRQFVEQRLCLFKIGGVEALCEPAVNRLEQIVRLSAPALFAP